MSCWDSLCAETMRERPLHYAALAGSAPAVQVNVAGDFVILASFLGQPGVSQYTLSLFNIAMENDPCMDDFPIETLQNLHLDWPFHNYVK